MTNKEKTAVAIEYVPGEAAPKILATGKGQVADFYVLAHQ